MTMLTTGELSKIASKGPYAGKKRTEIISLKIKNKQPFYIGSGSGTKFFAEKVDLKTSPIKLFYRNSNKKLIDISINKIYKDSDFGGGGGSGGGSENTDITESGQAYYFSLAFNIIKKQLKPEDCTDANLKKAAAYVTAKISLEVFLKTGPVSWIDDQTYIKTANKVFDFYRSNFSGIVYMHQGRSTDNFLKKIYEAKKRAQKIDIELAQKTGSQPQAPGSFADDKWNAGDVWMSSLSPTVDPFEKIKERGNGDWQELNNTVLDKAGELKSKGVVLLAVSLKKTGGVVSLTKYNTKVRKINNIIPFTGFIFGKNGDFFSSIDMYFKLGTAEVQFRAFNSTSSWQGEIKGAAAAGGKIGGGNVNYYCEKHFKKSIGKNSIMSGWRETSATGADMKNMYKLYKKYNTLQINKTSTIDEGEFVKMCKSKGQSFIFSKNMCLLFLDTFMSGNKSQKDGFATDLFRYGASNTDVSSFFVKTS